jgi:hypothetical protein
MKTAVEGIGMTKVTEASCAQSRTLAMSGINMPPAHYDLAP